MKLSGFLPALKTCRFSCDANRKYFYHCHLCLLVGIQKPNENFKNKLQEYAQRKKGALPEYTTTPQKFGDTNGFVCKVVVDGKEYISSFYLNKKDAEKNAAFAALMSLGLVSP